MKVLFILKKRKMQIGNEYTTFNSGLLNSASFVNDMLREDPQMYSKLVEVIDNNDIDREVNIFNPDIVIIEALWVVPEKFSILCKLHPNVKWVIRIHSHVPFLANEGIAMKWIKEYLYYPNIYIASNYLPCVEALKKINRNKIVYLPNYYPIEKLHINKKCEKHHKEIHIGCFGAIRPMKNQLIQAMAAINYANDNNETLYFHINDQRIENNGSNVLKNIEALFENSSHILVKHPWLSHNEFLELISKMDVGMQISLSETFNIVTADFISQLVPIITSPEISIVSSSSHVNPKDMIKMSEKIKYALRHKCLIKRNRKILKKFSDKSKSIWLKYIKG